MGTWKNCWWIFWSFISYCSLQIWEPGFIFFFFFAIVPAVQVGKFHLPNSKKESSNFLLKCHWGNLTKGSGCSWPYVLRVWLTMLPKLASRLIIWEQFTLSPLNPRKIQLFVWIPNNCHKIHSLILFLPVGKWWGMLGNYNKNKVCSQPRESSHKS